MDWMQTVDAYCERTGPALWAEPLNAATNLGYLFVGLWFARRLRGTGRLLAVLLIAIAVGSALFHTLATAWAGVADTVPIGLFILLYLYVLNREVLGWRPVHAGLGMLAFLPYAAALVPVLNRIPFVAISDFYWTVPLGLMAYAMALRRRDPPVARGLATASAVLCLSIVMRSLDLPLCGAWPFGTHFVWHVLNAVMFVIVLGTLQAHRAARGLAAGQAGR